MKLNNETDASGNFFLRQRIALGLTQRQIAIALNMTDSAVGSWERGDWVPRLFLSEKLAAVYGVPRERIEREIVKLTREVGGKVRRPANSQR